MSKDLFTPVNYDAAFPQAAQEEKPVDSSAPTTAEEIVAAINAELDKISRGASKMTSHAIQMRPGSTPFLMTLSTFQAEPTIDNAAILVAMAKQDIGHTFGEYVKSLVVSLCGGK